MAGSYLKVENPRRWSEILDQRLPWLGFDWRLLAPFFLFGAAAGASTLIWFVIFVAGRFV